MIHEEGVPAGDIQTMCAVNPTYLPGVGPLAKSNAAEAMSEKLVAAE